MLRNINTIPAGDAVIQDPVLEPYFIVSSTTGGYTVYERVSRSVARIQSVERNTIY